MDPRHVPRPIFRAQIGIGGSLAAPPLPHHRTYGSVSGGSLDYAVAGFARERSPSDLKKLVGMAMWSAGLTASRQGPWGLPAVFAARSRPTPQRRSSAKRAGPVFHCFQAMARTGRALIEGRRGKSGAVALGD
jgi:hypothetical protein